MEEGMRVQLETDQGPAIATITKIDGEQVTLDMNHPLADMELHFNVDLLEIREAEEEEINHGHVHGPTFRALSKIEMPSILFFLGHRSYS